MTAKLSKGMTGSGRFLEGAKRAATVAVQLQHECNVLLELFIVKEKLPDVRLAEGRLVSVPPSSSQLEATDRLWRLHLALEQCGRLLESAISREDLEFGDRESIEYKNQRTIVKGKLSLLLAKIGDLLKAMGGTTPLCPNHEIESPTSKSLLKVKLWIYSVFGEVGHWSKTAVTTLQELPTGTAKEPVRRGRTRRERRVLR